MERPRRVTIFFMCIIMALEALFHPDDIYSILKLGNSEKRKVALRTVLDRKFGSAASNVLRKPGSSKAEKMKRGSALTQR